MTARSPCWPSKLTARSSIRPNDVVVHPNDKSIWFTDPGYGTGSIYEGQKANTGTVQPYQKEAVYRLDRANRQR